MLGHQQITNDLDIVGYVHEGHPLRDHLFPDIMLEWVVILKQDCQLRDATEEHGGQSGGDGGKNPEENALHHRISFLVFKDLKMNNLNAKTQENLSYLRIADASESPVDECDNVAGADETDGGDEKVVEVETMIRLVL